MKVTEALPARMQKLPLDSRGYVVPWFVQWHAGEPEFRAMDGDKFIRALRQKLCWVCGERLGVHVTFVAGPMCGINRTNSEPPCHHDCALWSAKNCPFLANPRMVRREDGLPEGIGINESAAGFGLSRNPGVVMLWNTRTYDVFKVDHKGTGILIQMGEPESVEWFAEGRPATRAEVVASIESGLPALENLAREERGAQEALDRKRQQFEKWLPPDDDPPTFRKHLQETAFEKRPWEQ